MKSELMPKSDDEITLRELLAYAYAGASLYTDDGELQDSRRHPFIDFLRAAVEAIRALPRHNAVTGSYAVGVRMDCHDDGEWIYADDALRILEATDE
jgi:hypothetical protein